MLFAVVKQDTREDWNGVSLELLSQAPSANLDLPELRPYPALNHRDGEAGKGTLPAPDNPPAAASLITVKVPGKVSLRGGDEQRFRIASQDLTPSFRYLAIPRQGAEVHLMAMVVVPPGLPLVAGSPVAMLQGSERLGQLALELPAPGEPLRLSYGPVPGLSARLERLEQHRTELGDKTREREWVRKERLEVASTLATPVVVEVMDRTVASSTDSVQVDSETGTSPGWELVRPGLRSWVLRLEPGARAAVLEQTRIRGPLVGHLINVGDLALEGN